MILFDTNVLLDIATADPGWLAWSEMQFRTAATQGAILINPIIYAELAPAFASQGDLDRWLDPAVFQRLLCHTQAAGSPPRLFSNTAVLEVPRLRHCRISISEPTPRLSNGRW